MGGGRGDVPTGRYLGALAPVGQKLLLFGGRCSLSSYLGDAALFDQRTGSWTAVTGAGGTTPAGRSEFGGAAVFGCSVYYYGGRTGASSYSSELIRYEADATVTACTCAPGQTGANGNACAPCAAGTFKDAAGNHACTPCKVPPGLFCPAGSSSASGTICPAGFYCAGGAADKRPCNTWFQLDLSGDIPAARSAHGVTTVNNMIYLFGGELGQYWSEVYSNELFSINVANSVCTKLQPGITGSPPSARRAMGFAAWDGILYVWGGMSVQGNLNDFHAFELAGMQQGLPVHPRALAGLSDLRRIMAASLSHSVSTRVVRSPMHIGTTLKQRSGRPSRRTALSQQLDTATARHCLAQTICFMLLAAETIFATIWWCSMCMIKELRGSRLLSLGNFQLDAQELVWPQLAKKWCS